MQEIISVVIAPIIVIRLIALFGIYLDRKSFIYLIPIVAFFIYTNSALMTERDIYILESGYGTDIMHYLDAFYELINREVGSYQDLLYVAASNTSSAEPFFWWVTYILSIIFSKPEQIWLSLIFISLVIYSVALAKINPKYVLVGLILYVSTITFFVFAGSAIRQFLALSLLSISIAYHRNNKLFFLFLLLTLLTHGTMLFVVPLVLVSKVIAEKEYTYKTVMLYGAIFSLSISFLLIFAAPIVIKVFGGDSFILSKLNSKLSTESESFSWFIQFLIETVLFSVFCYYVNSRVPRFLTICFIILTLSVMGFSFLPGFGDRIYRSLYVIYTLYFAYYFAYLDTYLKKYFFATTLLLMSCAWYIYIYFERYQPLFFSGDEQVFFSFNPLLKILSN